MDLEKAVTDRRVEETGREIPGLEVGVSEEALKEAEKFVEAEEGAASHFKGKVQVFLIAVGVLMSLFHLYAAYGIVQAQVLRAIHVGFVLFLTFFLFPVTPRFRDRIMAFDVVLALLSVAAIVYMLVDFDDFIYRAVTPTRWDLFFGTALILLILEALRRTSGWIMLGVVVFFLAYAMLGAYLPEPWTHRGYDLERLVGQMYMTLEGIFGTPIDVSATFIILFTIYGAILQFSNAGKFFIDFSFTALGGSRAGAGRTVVLSSFLLGGPSGSGVATTVTLGAVAYPLLARAGYGKDAAGGLLAAGGLGAILSPPVLGAAAFLIAEFLKISYLDVILMATIPTLLYYLSLFVMVEIDSRKLGMQPVVIQDSAGLWALTRRYGFHFTSLVAIVVFMLVGYTAIAAVFWATIIAFVLSFLRKECALYPGKLVEALNAGSVGVLAVAVTCAAAGLIVGVVTLTGLGLKFSAIIIEYAGNSVLLTAIYSGLIVWIIGLAVPVTASYIICAVIVAPALTNLGVPDLRGPHVHLLLRRALRGLASHRPVALRGGGHHGGKSVQDDAPILEVHAARFHLPLHVRGGPRGRGNPPQGAVDGRGLDQPHGRHRDRGPCRRRAGVAVQENLACGALAPDRRGDSPGLSQADLRRRRNRTGGRRGRHAARFPAPSPAPPDSLTLWNRRVAVRNPRIQMAPCTVRGPERDFRRKLRGRFKGL